MFDSRELDESVSPLWARGKPGEYSVAVRLRLKRMGRKHQVLYRLSAMDTRSPRDGRVIEELGWYDPKAKDPEQQVSLNRERIEHWLSVGAQPSDTVRNLLKRRLGILVSR
jgi:small subunit ribosomal protein S16